MNCAPLAILMSLGNLYAEIQLAVIAVINPGDGFIRHGGPLRPIEQAADL